MRTQNITQTAERLFTSQPTVSRELARIEQLTGFVLFERKSGRIHPTESALILYEEVTASYVGLEKINQSIENLRQNRTKLFELCCQPFLSDRFIPNLFKKVLDQNLNIQMSLKTLESPYIEIELSKQKYHLGFIENKEAPQGTASICKLITQQVCILPKQHELKEKLQITLQDFQNENLICLSRTDPYQQYINTLLLHSDIKPIRNIEADRVHTICNMVTQGMGIAIINPLTALEYANELTIRPLDFELPFYVNLVQPIHKPGSNLIETFINSSICLLEEIKDLCVQNDLKAQIYRS